jgi:mono/diheme cytochrome c family protein
VTQWHKGLFVAAAALGLAGVVAAGVVLARDDAPTAPSFARDVAPILADNCAECHRQGGIAPFSLESAGTARSRAAAIAAAVESRRMPPWLPGPQSPAYRGEDERTLTDDEVETVVEWARSGARVDGAAQPAPARPPLRLAEGERRVELAPPRAYLPQGESDDYRCFLLDPQLGGDAYVTSAAIRPGAPSVVHHVILFRAAAEQVVEAERLDAQADGLGWPCFGGTGLGTSVDALDDAGWLAAWAPGGEPVRYLDGTGSPLAAGSRVVMQVHYNLLHGREADLTAAALTFAAASAELEAARTMLVPGPVELPCAPDERGALCERDAAIADLVAKRGREAAFLPAGLQLLCGGSPFGAPASGPVSSCDRAFGGRTTIHGVAGHMHLLGRSIRVELNPGTDRARVLLDIPRWDFHWQNAYTFVEPVVAEPGDRVRVTCRHDASLREGEPRYVVWGEGTTDEMCLAVLQVTRG